MRPAHHTATKRHEMIDNSSGVKIESLPTELGQRLMAEAEPFFVQLDEAGLCSHLRSTWSSDSLIELLEHDDAGVVRTVVICLGLIGRYEHSRDLSVALHHDDYFVVKLAEKALWSIWFRASNRRGCACLQHAIKHIHRGEFERADRILDQILIEDSAFAEACNQRAVLYYLTDRFEHSIVACRRTLALNQYHFGAAAGLGHNFMQLGQYEEAEKAYHDCLNLHPRMEGVRQALRQTRCLSSGYIPDSSWSRDPESVLSLESAARLAIMPAAESA